MFKKSKILQMLSCYHQCFPAFTDAQVVGSWHSPVRLVLIIWIMKVPTRRYNAGANAIRSLRWMHSSLWQFVLVGVAH